MVVQLVAELGAAARDAVSGVLPVLLSQGKQLGGANHGGNRRGQRGQEAYRGAARRETQVDDSQVGQAYRVVGSGSDIVETLSRDSGVGEQDGGLAGRAVLRNYVVGEGSD